MLIVFCVERTSEEVGSLDGGIELCGIFLLCRRFEKFVEY